MVQSYVAEGDLDEETLTRHRCGPRRRAVRASSLSVLCTTGVTTWPWVIVGTMTAVMDNQPGGTVVVMSVESEALLREALALPASERAQVAADLLESLDDPTEDDPDAVAAAWAEELEHRARRALAGQDLGQPWPEVRDQVRRNLTR